MGFTWPFCLIWYLVGSFLAGNYFITLVGHKIRDVSYTFSFSTKVLTYESKRVAVFYNSHVKWKHKRFLFSIRKSWDEISFSCPLQLFSLFKEFIRYIMNSTNFWTFIKYINFLSHKMKSYLAWRLIYSVFGSTHETPTKKCNHKWLINSIRYPTVFFYFKQSLRLHQLRVELLFLSIEGSCWIWMAVLGSLIYSTIGFLDCNYVFNYWIGWYYMNRFIWITTLHVRIHPVVNVDLYFSHYHIWLIHQSLVMSNRGPN